MRDLLILLILISSCKKTIQETPVITITSFAFIKDGYVHFNIHLDKIANSNGYIQGAFTTKWQTNFIASVPTPYNRLDTICKTNYPADTVYNYTIFKAYIFGAKIKF